MQRKICCWLDICECVRNISRIWHFLIATTANTDQKIIYRCQHAEIEKERVSGQAVGWSNDRFENLKKLHIVWKSIKLLAPWKMDGAAHKEITISNYHLRARVQMVSVTTITKKNNNSMVCSVY